MRPFTNMHIMKKYILLFLCLIIVSGSFAQMQDFKFKFYGQIRTDFYYNSRANEETVDGLFYMYPKDKVRDPDGNDLNSTPNSNFYTLYSRLGVDIAGPKLGTAKTSAKVEVDFRGTGTSYSVIRLRHAYLNLDWGKSTLLLGQNWHPLFGDVSPQILNLSVGAPFQPFSRAPQIRYRYTNKNFQLTGAAVWQSQYTSPTAKGVGSVCTDIFFISHSKTHKTDNNIVCFQENRITSQTNTIPRSRLACNGQISILNL